MLIHQSEYLFSTLLESKDLKGMQSLFNVSTSEYWINHFRFDTFSKGKTKMLGRSTINNLLINTVIPFLFLFGLERDKNELKELAIKLLENLEPESNRISKQWESIGIKGTNAYDSQGLLQLYNHYCTGRKCLNCAIGTQILR